MALRPMKLDPARQIGDELTPILERLKAMAREERAKRSAYVEALEIAIVNLDSAIEILTD